jgi:regulator of replication initiation timing
MSELPSRHPEALLEEIARLKAENARLKTEVQHLMVFCNCTLIPNKELQAQVERLTKAGDAMADYLFDAPYPCRVFYHKWKEAKEGKPHA